MILGFTSAVILNMKSNQCFSSVFDCKIKTINLKSTDHEKWNFKSKMFSLSTFICHRYRCCKLDPKPTWAVSLSVEKLKSHKKEWLRYWPLEIFRIFWVIQRFCGILKYFMKSVSFYKCLLLFFTSLAFLYIAQNL